MNDPVVATLKFAKIESFMFIEKKSYTREVLSQNTGCKGLI